MDRLVGSSEQRCATALELVRSMAPCVMLLDETEKLIGQVRPF